MKVLKNKHSCNVLLDFNNKIHVTFIVPKLIIIAHSHIMRLSSSCEEGQHKRFLSLLGLLSYPPGYPVFSSRWFEPENKHFCLLKYRHVVYI